MWRRNVRTRHCCRGRARQRWFACIRGQPSIFVAATPPKCVFRVEVYGREARVRTRRQHQFGYPNELVSLSCRGPLAIVAAWSFVVVVVDGGVTNTYALTGLEVNLYAKKKDYVSHLNASFWWKRYRTRARPKVRPVAIVGSRASGAGGDAKKVSQAPATTDASQVSQGNQGRIKGPEKHLQSHAS